MKAIRYIAITDIQPLSLNPHTEIDDVQSLVRLFLYSNTIDLEGIIPCTSVYKKRIKCKDITIVHKVIKAYGVVKKNLDRHAKGFPEEEYLHSIVKQGIPKYGKGVGSGFAHKRYSQNKGVLQIIDAVDRADERPIWIGLWGGTNTLAQAIWQVENERTEKQFNEFLSKLRIYGISDQDAASKWLRQTYGDRIFYIVSPSEGSIAGNNRTFCHATWPGISCDHFLHGSADGRLRGGFTGARADLISKEWVKNNIQIGSYGKMYPSTVYCMEGDSPSFLGLIANGLNVPEHPEYGGWGGRYEKKMKASEEARIWTDTKDTVIGIDGNRYCSPQATIWRWREAFQNDFAARMEWTLADENIDYIHPPVIRLSKIDKAVLKSGDSITISAAKSYDIDHRKLKFKWFPYREAGSYDGSVKLDGTNTNTLQVTIPEQKQRCGILHLILEVTNETGKSMTSYKRILLNINM